MPNEVVLAKFQIAPPAHVSTYAFVTRTLKVITIIMIITYITTQVAVLIYFHPIIIKELTLCTLSKRRRRKSVFVWKRLVAKKSSLAIVVD